MGHQRDHQGHRLGRGAQAIEDRAFRRGESLTALRAHESLVLARVDANISLACLAAGRAGQIRAGIVVGSMPDCPPLALLGNMPRGVWLAPHFRYKRTSPRFSGELPNREYLLNMIGKIARVPLRDVWKHEAYDLTRWLEQNIDVLSDAVGLSLANPEREQAAGTFSVRSRSRRCGWEPCRHRKSTGQDRS